MRTTKESIRMEKKTILIIPFTIKQKKSVCGQESLRQKQESKDTFSLTGSKTFLDYEKDKTKENKLLNLSYSTSQLIMI